MAISREKVEAFWAANDTNNDGELSVDEVKAALQSQSSQCQLSAEDVESLGLTSGSKCSKDQFMEAFKNKRKAVLTEVFKKMDSDGSGKLNTKEIIEVLKSEGIYNDDDITAMCTKCKDSDGDQAVNLAEFIEAAM